MPFVNRRSGNPGGRRERRQNNISAEIRTLAQSLFDDAYWRGVKAKLTEGTLHPSIEAKLLTYSS